MKSSKDQGFHDLQGRQSNHPSRNPLHLLYFTFLLAWYSYQLPPPLPPHKYPEIALFFVLDVLFSLSPSISSQSHISERYNNGATAV